MPTRGTGDVRIMIDDFLTVAAAATATANSTASSPHTTVHHQPFAPFGVGASSGCCCADVS